MIDVASASRESFFIGIGITNFDDNSEPVIRCRHHTPSRQAVIEVDGKGEIDIAFHQRSSLGLYNNDVPLLMFKVAGWIFVLNVVEQVADETACFAWSAVLTYVGLQQCSSCKFLSLFSETGVLSLSFFEESTCFARILSRPQAKTCIRERN